MENFIKILIYTHAAFGGIALVVGAVATLAKKGNKVHKKSGKVFYISMLISAIISLIVAVLPNHKSPFLFSIGLFSLYFLISGYRSLNFKKNQFSLKIDKGIAIVIIITGIIMISYPLLISGKINIILFIFGSTGLVFGLRDWVLFKNLSNLKTQWLKLHLGKMTGGYIAAVTAFFVVNEILPGIINWFLPGIIGGIYISYWIIKLNKNIKHNTL